MNQDMAGDRPQFTATCAECGKEATVPFQPSGDRPVYCRDCFAKRRSSGGGQGGGARQLYDATCSTCGKATQVPFRPSGDRPVYCRDCFRSQRA